QHGILKRLLNNIPLPPFVFGGVRGRSVRDAASVHVGSPCIVALDIANCFGSVTHSQVFDAFRHRVNCSTEVAGLLTRLTTLRRCLPQGAPTSPALANLVLLKVYNRVVEIAEEYKLSFSF